MSINNVISYLELIRGVHIPLEVILVAIVIVVLGVLWLTRHRRTVINIVDLAVSKAERAFKHGDNQAKLDFVLNKVRRYIPPYLQFLYSTEVIKKLIDAALLRIEKELDYQKTILPKTELELDLSNILGSSAPIITSVIYPILKDVFVEATRIQTENNARGLDLELAIKEVIRKYAADETKLENILRAIAQIAGAQIAGAQITQDKK